MGKQDDLDLERRHLLGLVLAGGALYAAPLVVSLTPEPAVAQDATASESSGGDGGSDGGAASSGTGDGGSDGGAASSGTGDGGSDGEAASSESSDGGTGDGSSSESGDAPIGPGQSDWGWSRGRGKGLANRPPRRPPPGQGS